MARPLKNGQVLADPVGAPDFTLPVSILAQIIESLKVDIVAQSIPKLGIEILGSSPTVVLNVAQSGTWTINIGAPLDASGNLKTSIQSSVTLNVNITNCNVTLNVNVTNSSLNVNVTNTSLNVNVTNSTLTVTVSGTVNVNITNSQLNVNVTNTSITVSIGAPLDASGNLKTSIQSSVTINVNITNCNVTLNVNITNSSLNVNVTNTSLSVYVTNSTLTVTVSGTVNVNVTNSTLTVTISGTPTVNIQTSGGANIVIDKLTQGAYTERRSDIYNHGATATMVANNYTYKRGKFFPRGCRGFLQRVWIYCDNTDTVAHTLTVKFSPAPGMGAVYTVSASVAAGSSAAWRYIDVKKFWNYDSMFIWASFDINAYGRLGYDTGTPYDYYYSTDEATWTPDNYRYWIYVTISGETVGDLPVSGTVNTIGVPALSSKYAVSSAYVPQNTETTVLTVKGAGECDMIICRAHTNTYSHVTEFRIYCDEILAFQDTPDNLNTFGFTSSSPGISLLRFTANGDCIFVITKRFGFRNALRIAAYNAAGAAAVSVSVFANLIA
jgi:hypothetical protein